MEVFLPIAEVSVNIIAIFSLSGIVGILSGLFGVGGGFLMTPFLIFLGVPPAYAVANEANNILAKILFASFATAYAGGTPKKIKNGVIKKPPPTPNKPESIPTIPLREKIAIMLTDTSAIGKKTSIKT